MALAQLKLSNASFDWCMTSGKNAAGFYALWRSKFGIWIGCTNIIWEISRRFPQSSLWIFKGAVHKKAWGSSGTSLGHPLENAIQTERLLMVTRMTMKKRRNERERRDECKIIRESWLPWSWIFKIATHHIMSYNYLGTSKSRRGQS